MTVDLVVGLAIGLVLGVLGMMALGMFNTLKAQAKRGPVSPPKAPEPVVEPEAPARLMDPQNPPTWLRWRPKRDDAEAPVCVCHGRPIEAGEDVLWWPVPDGEPGQVVLLCEEGISKPDPGLEIE